MTSAIEQPSLRPLCERKRFSMQLGRDARPIVGTDDDVGALGPLQDPANRERPARGGVHLTVSRNFPLHPGKPLLRGRVRVRLLILLAKT